VRWQIDNVLTSLFFTLNHHMNIDQKLEIYTGSIDVTIEKTLISKLTYKRFEQPNGATIILPKMSIALRNYSEDTPVTVNVRT
jgi:hypothetical protein